jgi:hypothetical protein
MKSDKVISATCSICGNESSFDKQTLKGSTWIINGIKIILCCPCEDDLFKKILPTRISKKRMMELTHILMSDERNDILELYR